MPESLSFFLSFLKIGIFTFGGGYAMIPLVQREVIDKGWVKEDEFLELLTLAQSAPGPIALNTAVFVGYKVHGYRGMLAAVMGIILPAYTGDCDIFQFDSREPCRRSGIQRNPSGCRRVDACAGVRFLEGIGLDAGDSRGSRGLRRVVFCRFTRLYDYRWGYGRHRVRLVEAAPQFA